MSVAKKDVPGLTLRMATAADAELINDMIAAFAAYERLPNQSSAQALRTEFSSPDRVAEAVLAFLDGVPVGFAVFFQTYDRALSPVLHAEPPRLGELGPEVAVDRLWERLTHYVSYTPIHNAAGVPAMSIPLGQSPTGLPIGSQFAAGLGGERTLFEMAFELEQARPWASRWAPTSVQRLEPRSPA